MKNTYQVKEIFGPTIQGEGGMTGTPVMFIRFAGCNMWDGKKEHRKDSMCPYCDTDFYGGTKMTLEQIIEDLKRTPKGKTEWVVLSGGEPGLQVDQELVTALHKAHFKVAIETNGTRELPWDIDYVVVSPKVPFRDLAVREAHDLKLLFPHPNPKMTPDSFREFAAENRFLQPIMDDDREEYSKNLESTIKACIQDGWRLSLQTHKAIGVK